MLITFSCKSHSNVTMFGDVGLQLIKLLGHSGDIPGALDASSIPDALARLREAIEAEKRLEKESKQSTGYDDIDDDLNADDLNEDDSYTDVPVNIANRAFPLLELLESAVKEECEVMWEDSSNKSF
ncbi:DUF1840 domain-containing protein [Vibrio kagoshimensis]|uniref:DUF1840 domain-containing protein n=1 Tax=Vibrio kagoshimensis TaxID=2910244 RepID=UPI003D20624E